MKTTAYCYKCDEVEDVEELHFETRRIMLKLACGHEIQYEAELRN